MRTIICLALLMLAVYASPIDNVYSALDILDMPDLLESDKGFDLTASFTYLGGIADGEDGEEKVLVRGYYNLLTFEGDSGKLKTGSFNKTKPFTTKGVVNFTGSGTFGARGGGSKAKGYFNGDSTTDFSITAENENANNLLAVRVNWYTGTFEGKKYEGTGHIEVEAFKNSNFSSNSVDYSFKGSKAFEFYSGGSKGYASTVIKEQDYQSSFSTVFHGINQKDKWSVSGTYSIDVYDTKGEEVWKKEGNFAKNGTNSGDALDSLSHIQDFVLPQSNFNLESNAI